MGGDGQLYIARGRDPEMTSPGWNAPALVWVVTASVLAGGLFVWPLHIVLVAGQNADLALVAAWCWGGLIALFQPPRDAVRGWTRRLLTALDSVALLGIFSLDCIVLNQLATMLQSIYYYQTPKSALVLPLVAVIGVAVNRTPVSVWRMVTFFVPVLIVLSLGIFGLALVNLHHPRAIFPIPDIALTSILQGLGIIAYVGVPVGVTLRRASARMAEQPTWRGRLVALALPAGFLGVVYAITMGALGPAALIDLRWPVVFVLDHVTLDSTFFLSRIGIVVVFSWTLGVAMGLAVHLRLLWAVAPVRQSVRVIGSTVLLGIWGGSALVLNSPTTSTYLLLRWLDPMATWYLVVELAVLIGIRMVWMVRGYRRESTIGTATDV